jgi:hypothetical protein
MAGEFSSIGQSLQLLYGPQSYPQAISVTTGLMYLDQHARAVKKQLLTERCSYCTSKQVQNKTNCPNCGGPY